MLKFLLKVLYYFVVTLVILFVCYVARRLWNKFNVGKKVSTVLKKGWSLWKKGWRKMQAWLS